MARLSEAVKTLIVQRLATFTTPTDVQREVKETHGVELDLAHIVYYDATNKHSDLGKKYRKLFDAARDGFIKSTTDIAIAHKSYRLQELARMYRKLMSQAKPNMVLAKEILEQAAKEMGEAYTNRRQLVSPNPLEDLARLLNLAPHELAQALAVEGIDATATGSPA